MRKRIRDIAGYVRRPAMHAGSFAQGQHVGRKRVWRLMRAAHLKGVSRRRKCPRSQPRLISMRTSDYQLAELRLAGSKSASAHDLRVGCQAPGATGRRFRQVIGMGH